MAEKKGQTTRPAAPKERKSPPTRDERNAAWRSQGGKCYVTGADLDPMEGGREWTLVHGNRAVTRRVAREMGGRSAERFKTWIALQVAEAKMMLDTYGHLVYSDGVDGRLVVTFFGEMATQEVGGEIEAVHA